MSNETETYYTIEDLAAQINVHPDTIRRLLRTGKLPGFKLSANSRGPWRVRASDWETYLQSLIPQYLKDMKTDQPINQQPNQKGTNHVKR